MAIVAAVVAVVVAVVGAVVVTVAVAVVLAVAVAVAFDNGTFDSSDQDVALAESDQQPIIQRIFVLSVFAAVALEKWPLEIF